MASPTFINNSINFTEQPKCKYILKLVHDFMDLVESMKCGKGVPKMETKTAEILGKTR